MLTNVTVMLSRGVADWLSKRAAEENISVSRFIARMVEAEMRHKDYEEAFRLWQKLEPIEIDARKRLSREEAHARR